MKSRRQRKRQEEHQSSATLQKQDQVPLKIKFDISSDNIACFIGDKKSIRKRQTKGSASLKKSKQPQQSKK